MVSVCARVCCARTGNCSQARRTRGRARNSDATRGGRVAATRQGSLGDFLTTVPRFATRLACPLVSELTIEGSVQEVNYQAGVGCRALFVCHFFFRVEILDSQPASRLANCAKLPLHLRGVQCAHAAQPRPPARSVHPNPVQSNLRESGRPQGVPDRRHAMQVRRRAAAVQCRAQRCVPGPRLHHGTTHVHPRNGATRGQKRGTRLGVHSSGVRCNPWVDRSIVRVRVRG